MSFLNLAFSIISLINIRNQNSLKQNMLLTVAISVQLATFLWDTIQRIVVYDPTNLVCADKTQWHTVTAPSSTKETGNNALLARNCHVYSLLSMYQEYIFFTCSFLIFVELYAKIVLRRGIKEYRKWYFCISIFLSIGNALLATFYGNPLMIQPGTPGTRCEWSTGDFYLDFYLRDLSHAILYVMCVYMGIHIAYILFHLLSKSDNKEEDGQSFREHWNTDSVVLNYLPVFIFIQAPLLFWYGLQVNTIEATSMYDSTQSWVRCIFDNYASSADQSLVDSLCGVYPKFTVSTIPEDLMIIVLSVLFSGFTTLITFDKKAVYYWKTVFYCCSQMLEKEDQEQRFTPVNPTKELHSEDDEVEEYEMRHNFDHSTH
jgi:hypothetical protein